jgi:cobalt-zinc-cadmium efflux system protein
VAVIFGGLAIWKFNLVWLDPLITVLVGMYIIYHTRGVVKETVNILMQAVPPGINPEEIKTEVEKNSEIDNFHHLHVWKLNDTQIHLEAHVNLKNNISMAEMMDVRANLEKMLKSKFSISHITLQIGYKCCDGHNELINNRGNSS